MSAAGIKSMYDRTGDIRDVNTVLVPLAKLRELQADAARYEFLKTRLVAADFDWQESGESVIVFSWPDAPVSADCDATIDAGIKATGGAK